LYGGLNVHTHMQAAKKIQGKAAALNIDARHEQGDRMDKQSFTNCKQSTNILTADLLAVAR